LKESHEFLGMMGTIIIFRKKKIHIYFCGYGLVTTLVRLGGIFEEVAEEKKMSKDECEYFYIQNMMNRFS